MNSSDFFFLFVSIVAAAEFDCPKPDGQFQDERQCDKYYVCDDGVAKAKLCPDGLVFDPLNRKINKCDQPFNVDCEDRTELRKDLRELFLSLSGGFNLYFFFFQRNPSRPNTVHARTVSLPIPRPASATSSTTVSMVMRWR